VVPGLFIWINPPTYKYSPNLVEFISLNPYTYVGDLKCALLHVMLTVYNDC
jgi:hypothetical protein